MVGISVPIHVGADPGIFDNPIQSSTIFGLREINHECNERIAGDVVRSDD